MDANKPTDGLEGREETKTKEESVSPSENPEKKEEDEPKNVIQGERLKAIEDLRKKFKSQHLNSVKGVFGRRANNLHVSENDQMKADQFRTSHNIKFQDRYTIFEVIGQGSCAVAKRICEKATNEIFAVKIVKIRDQESLNFLRAEYEILSKLEHKNIIKAKEFLVDNETGTAYFVLEYAKGKSLQQLIVEKTRINGGPIVIEFKSSNPLFIEETMRPIIEQLVSAIKYIHEKGVCHRDIVPSNIIINEETNDVKLIDFSVSKIFKKELWSPSLEKASASRKKSSPLLPHYPGLMLTDTGTPAYKAPEIIIGVPYNQSIDMWSVGVVLFYALAGYRPFQSKYLDKIYKKISKGNVKWDPVAWKNISYEATLFVKCCLTKLPFLRLQTKEALHHPWIKGVKLQPEKNDDFNKPLRKCVSFQTKTKKDTNEENSGNLMSTILS